MSHHSHGNTTAEFADLTEGKIHTLYEIIQSAEKSSYPPIRALFFAHRHVLRSHGIQPERDQFYFNFMLRMREAVPAEYGLFASFKDLLETLGFEVDREEIAEAEGTAHHPGPELQDTDTVAQDARSLPPRRASFTSIQDTIASQQLQQHKLSIESRRGVTRRSRSQNSIPKTPNTRKGSIRHAPQDFQPGPIRRTTFEQSSDRGRVSNGKIQKHVQLASPIKLSSPGSEIQECSLDESSDALNGTEWSVEAPQLTSPWNTLTTRLNEQNLLQLEIEAKSRRFKHLASLAYWLFRGWKEKSHDRRVERVKFSQLAHSRHSTALKQQSLVQWERALRVKRVYSGLEKRAGEARELFLVTKAFTHWAQSASDEVLRTSAARRHILRTRYFNAWREMTVVNELKVRRFRLDKSMSKWGQRHAEKAASNNFAIEKYACRLLENTYRRWFWQFCEHRAPLWYELRLRAQYFQRWLGSARNTNDDVSRAQNRTDGNVLKIFLTSWAQRTTTIWQNSERALQFRNDKLASFAYWNMQREIELVNPKSQLHRIVDTRILRSVFSRWLYMARIAIEAKRVHELRVMRNAWTGWNDGLRCQYMSRRIDNRVGVLALYRWVLAERSVFSLRIQDERLRALILPRWRVRAKIQSSLLECADDAVKQSRQRREKVSILQKWSNKTDLLSHLNQSARRCRTHSVLRGALETWKCRQQEISRLNNLADWGQFFVLSKISFRKWNVAIESNRKRRRREAYASVRRTLKMNLARAKLGKWRTNTTAYLKLQYVAAEKDQSRVITLGTTIFNEWRKTSHDLFELGGRAMEHRLESLGLAVMEKLIVELRHVQELDGSASAHGRVWTLDRSARESIRKLSWRCFRNRELQKTANSFGERLMTDHQRKMLRFWCEQTTSRRIELSDMMLAQSLPYPANRPEATQQLMVQGSHVGYAEAQAGKRSTSTANTPGYLRTPSRRTGIKNRSQVAAPSTPAPSQITPFVNRLRAQYSDSRITRFNSSSKPEPGSTRPPEDIDEGEE